jgi:hypothetical protein
LHRGEPTLFAAIMMASAVHEQVHLLDRALHLPTESIGDINFTKVVTKQVNDFGKKCQNTNNDGRTYEPEK